MVGGRERGRLELSWFPLKSLQRRTGIRTRRTFRRPLRVDRVIAARIRMGRVPYAEVIRARRTAIDGPRGKGAERGTDTASLRGMLGIWKTSFEPPVTNCRLRSPDTQNIHTSSSSIVYRLFTFDFGISTVTFFHFCLKKKFVFSRDT